MGKLFKRTVIGLAIGLGFIWLSARDWPLESLLGSLSISDGSLRCSDLTSGALLWSMDLLWLGPYLGILTLVHVLRVVRWKPLLDPIINLDWVTHNRIGAVGFMAMFLLPVRLGELVRPYLVKKRAGGQVRMTEVLSTVVVERVADGLVVSLILFAVLSELPATHPGTVVTLRIGAVGALGAFVGVSLLLAAAAWRHENTVQLINGTIGRVLPGVSARIVDLLGAFVRGLRTLPSTGAYAMFIFLTVVYWLVNGFGVWCMARAFGLSVDAIGAYAMMACVVVGMMIPNSPGNVGSFWYFLLLPLPLYGIGSGPENVQAVAFGVMVWLLQCVQQTAFGAWFVIRGQVTWRGILEATDEDSLDAEPIAPMPAPNVEAATHQAQAK